MRKRSGWAVLLAVAGLLLGGALAVRLSKRATRPSKRGTRPSKRGTRPSKRGTRPSKRGTRPSKHAVHLNNRDQSAAPTSDASRQLVRMAIGGAVAVVLAIGICIVTRPSDSDGTATAARDQHVVVHGLDGSAAEVSIDRILGDRDGRTTIFTIAIDNVGDELMSADLAPGSYLTLDHHRAVRPDRGFLRPGDDPVVMLPGRSTIRPVAFTLPPGARPVRLHVELEMNGGSPGVDWRL